LTQIVTIYFIVSYLYLLLFNCATIVLVPFNVSNGETDMAKKSTAIVPTMLRIREDLRKRLEREAKKRDHSLNAEMAERLEKSFADEAQATRDSAIVDLLTNHNDISGKLLRDIASQIAKHPDWPETESNRTRFLLWLATAIHGKEPQGEPQPGDDQ
jgi:hypothetical protein